MNRKNEGKMCTKKVDVPQILEGEQKIDTPVDARHDGSQNQAKNVDDGSESGKVLGCELSLEQAFDAIFKAASPASSENGSMVDDEEEEKDEIVDVQGRSNDDGGDETNLHTKFDGKKMEKKCCDVDLGGASVVARTRGNKKGAGSKENGKKSVEKFVDKAKHEMRGSTGGEAVLDCKKTTFDF